MIRSVQCSPRWVGLIFTILMFLAAASTAFGQAASGTGTISGLVTDATGAVVPEADVIVRNMGTNVARNLKSNDAGLYEAVSLQPGSYEVKATKPGFATLTRTGITLVRRPASRSGPGHDGFGNLRDGDRERRRSRRGD